MTLHLGHTFFTEGLTFILVSVFGPLVQQRAWVKTDPERG
jgi:hypothetical protein